MFYAVSYEIFVSVKDIGKDDTNPTYDTIFQILYNILMLKVRFIYNSIPAIYKCSLKI